jgi:hypothetical protein
VSERVPLGYTNAMHRAWMVLAVATCGSKPPPAPPQKPNPPLVVAPPPACIKPMDDEPVAITNAVADGDRVQYCVGVSSDQCFGLDTQTGKFERLAAPPKPETAGSGPSGSARVVTTNPDLKVCQQTDCKTLTQQVLPAAAQIRAATNATGSIAVFLLGDAEAGKGYAEVWDVAAQKKLATFKYARGDFKCGDVAILDDTIYVSAATCGQPAARAALYSFKGRKIANVGGADYGVYGNAYASVETNQYAFLDENGAQIVVQDLAKGKVLKKIDTSVLFKDTSGASMGNPGESALVRIGAGKVAVIAGAPSTGHVAIVDVTTGEVKIVKATLCGS